MKQAISAMAAKADIVFGVIKLFIFFISLYKPFEIHHFDIEIVQLENGTRSEKLLKKTESCSRITRNACFRP